MKIKAFLINIAKKHEGLRMFMRKAAMYAERLKYNKYKNEPVDDHTILFESFIGRKYVDSPKAIYEYMKDHPDYQAYQFIWFFNEPDKYSFLEKHPRTRVFKHKSDDYYKYYATSKYWITNSRITDAILKKPEQVYVQCWHGTPLKRLGFDIEVESGNAMNSIKDIHYKYEVDAKKYSYMLSPSRFCSEKFISAFHLDYFNKEDILIEEGYPRNDALINYREEDVSRIKEVLGLDPDKKVILYAPTWRDNMHEAGVGYIYHTAVDFDRLRDQFGENTVILFRAHYFVANSFDFKKYEGFVYNVSDYDDINDLYIIADLLITDYSSVFFDYANLKRPIIFYMYDLESYKTQLRDFYIDLEELPGPIVENEEDLMTAISLSDTFVYDERYKRFNEKFNTYDDGHASERVVKRLFGGSKWD